jgi:hypothetical protein
MIEQQGNVFGYPILGRYGLGNMLFPWARCYIWCRDNGIPMIAPRWTYLRIGPYLRREGDKRNYGRLFRNQGYVRGLRQILLLLTGVRYEEDKRAEVLQKIERHTPSIVSFKGIGDYFSPIKSRHVQVLSELRRITKPVYIKDMLHGQFVGVHVRRGDFSVTKDIMTLREGYVNYRIPLEWYISILRLIRNSVGWEAKAYVFSDGSVDELSKLLSMPNTSLFRGGSAIADLLALSRARVMIASGSTFSMWASYLGQVPCVWYPGQRRQYVISSNNDPGLEPELDEGDMLPSEFLFAAKQRWKG